MSSNNFCLYIYNAVKFIDLLDIIKNVSESLWIWGRKSKPVWKGMKKSTTNW